MSGDPATSVFVQWKGTDVCLDFHCVCGMHGHVEGRFAYYLHCTSCGRTFEMPHTFALVEVDGWDEGPATQPVFPSTKEQQP